MCNYKGYIFDTSSEGKNTACISGLVFTPADDELGLPSKTRLECLRLFKRALQRDEENQGLRKRECQQKLRTWNLPCTESSLQKSGDALNKEGGTDNF